MPYRRLATLLLLVLGAPAAAQHVPGHHQPGPAPSQPYAGVQDRPLKALTPAQVEDLRAGRGMALALPAELNRYPGPMHALEHQAALSLTEAQVGRLRTLMLAMRDDAITAGARVLVAEQALETVFVSGAATEAAVSAATAGAGAAWASLRAVHLIAHIATRDVLTADQTVRYEELRGYRRGG